MANVGDGGRDSHPIHFNEHFLSEVHFPTFRACIERGGTSATANDWLLNKTLKHDWKFPGFVISDANAVGGTIVLHYTAPDFPASGEQAINGDWMSSFRRSTSTMRSSARPLPGGHIDPAKLDEAVSSVLKAKF